MPTPNSTPTIRPPGTMPMPDAALKSRPPRPPAPVPLPPFQHAGSNDRPGMVVAQGLHRAIDGHLARHFVPTLRALTPARFLVITGGPGDGKTTSTKVICSRRQVDLVVISGGDLSGSTEDGSLAAFKEALVGIAKIRSERQLPIALLIDDADLGSFATGRDHVEYAVSSFVLQSALQKFSDDVCDGDPLPVFVTINELDVFRAPLFRHGRANIYVHEISLPEKIEQVSAILGASTEADRAVVASLVDSHKDQPIAFFASLKDAAMADAISELVQELGISGMPLEWATRSRLKNLGVADYIKAATTKSQKTAGSFLNGGQQS